MRGAVADEATRPIVWSTILRATQYSGGGSSKVLVQSWSGQGARYVPDELLVRVYVGG